PRRPATDPGGTSRIHRRGQAPRPPPRPGRAAQAPAPARPAHGGRTRRDGRRTRPVRRGRVHRRATGRSCRQPRHDPAGPPGDALPLISVRHGIVTARTAMPRVAYTGASEPRWSPPATPDPCRGARLLPPVPGPDDGSLGG